MSKKAKKQVVASYQLSALMHLISLDSSIPKSLAIWHTRTHTPDHRYFIIGNASMEVHSYIATSSESKATGVMYVHDDTVT